MTKHQNILIKNIYYMLSYVLMGLRNKNYENIAAEEFEHLHDLLATILIKALSRQLKQGLHREYKSRQENLATLSGRIDMAGTVKNFIAQRRLLSCEYDELTEDNFLNRIAKSTCLLLLKSKGGQAIKDSLRLALRKILLFLANVGTLNPFYISWHNIRFPSHSRPYRLIIGICELIIKGLLLTTEQGEYKLASFLHDEAMSRLYEKFILEYYRQEIPDLAARPAKISWALDDGHDHLLPCMKSDVTMTLGEQSLIIDAKCYAHTTQTSHGVHKVDSANLYQIFSYVKNMAANYPEGAHEVAGMLLYAMTDDDVQPNETYYMSGHKISVRVLDLSKDFSFIKAQLNKIAREHFAGLDI